jgi:hypothetical protein
VLLLRGYKPVPAQAAAPATPMQAPPPAAVPPAVQAAQAGTEPAR